MTDDIIEFYVDRVKTTEHDDLMLVIPKLSYLPEGDSCGLPLSQVADSYYFWLDEPTTLAPDGIFKLLDLIQLLLAQWLQRVEALSPGQITFLPFDFSDQYIGCIRVYQPGSNWVEISYGVTTFFQGYAILPSNLGPFIMREEDFIPDTNSVGFSKQDVVDNIARLMERMK